MESLSFHQTGEYFNSPFWIQNNTQSLQSSSISIPQDDTKLFIAQSRGHRHLENPTQLLQNQNEVIAFTSSSQQTLMSKPFAFPNEINVKYKGIVDLLPDDEVILILNKSWESRKLRIREASPDTLRFEFRVPLPQLYLTLRSV